MEKWKFDGQHLNRRQRMAGQAMAHLNRSACKRFSSAQNRLRPSWQRYFQALSETPLYRLATLSREIGLTFEDLDHRFAVLFGTRLQDAQQWKHGGH